MTKMVRKQIYIEPHQESTLKRLARETGATEAEIIREAIDRQAALVFIPRRDVTAWKAERAFVEELIQQAPVSPVRRWSREELHER